MATTIEGQARLEEKLKQLPRGINSLLKRVFFTGSTLVAGRIRTELVTNETTESSVTSKSGNFRRSIRAVPVSINAVGVTGGIQSTAPYAKTHIGKPGTSLTIYPRNAKALAIPIGEALTQAGIARGGPRSGMFGEMSFIPFATPHVSAYSETFGMLVGKRATTSGVNKGKLHGKITPLFLLARWVKIRRRISTDTIMEWMKEQIINGLRGGVNLNELKAG